MFFSKRDLYHAFLFTPVLRNFLKLKRDKKASYFLSYPKCGRTWVGNVAQYYVVREKGIEEKELKYTLMPGKENPEYLTLGRKVVFTHDILNRLKNRKLKYFSFNLYRGHPCIVLVRHPGDLLVSYYYHCIKKQKKLWISPETTIDEFILDLPVLNNIVFFYNQAVEEEKRNAKLKIIKYEDLKAAENLGVWKETLSLLFDENINEDHLNWAVEQNEFNKMQQREIQQVRNNDVDIDSNILRTRSGQVRGYKSELKPDTVTFLHDYIDTHLNDYYTCYKNNDE